MQIDSRFLPPSALANKDNINPFLHANILDKQLGYKISKIESKLRQKYRSYDQIDNSSCRKRHFSTSQAWIGLPQQSLQTPYCYLYHALAKLNHKKIEHVVDIGAGYGRVGIVLNTINPSARFTGFEILRRRQIEGERVFEKLCLKNSSIKLQNVLSKDFVIPNANVYFIYDFSEQEDILFILKKLSIRNKMNSAYLVARGKRLEYLLKFEFNRVWTNLPSYNTDDLRVYISGTCSQHTK